MEVSRIGEESDLAEDYRRINSAGNWAIGLGIFKVIASLFLLAVGARLPLVSEYGSLDLIFQIWVGSTSLYFGLKIKREEFVRLRWFNWLIGLYSSLIILNLLAAAAINDGSTFRPFLSVIVLYLLFRGRKSVQRVQKSTDGVESASLNDSGDSEDFEENEGYERSATYDSGPSLKEDSVGRGVPDGEVLSSETRQSAAEHFRVGGQAPQAESFFRIENTNAYVEQLERLAVLKEKGMLTNEEYEKLKRQIMERL